MSNLNLIIWKEFKIKEIFFVKRGKRLKSENRKNGNINYYSTSNFNNGLTDKISNPLFIEKKSIIFTTFGYCYYIEDIFTASDEVNILKLKSGNLNKWIGLFLVTIINQLKHKFSFGRKAFMNRILNEVISLPIDNENNPNWEFMEKYIKERTKNIYL
ncbi:restriction endonuclease subunit S [Spiroplasma endosymbiont of Villa modesta]|uniref:restriction endonuclease subunit S n=1 Tax=Spiroplasma endosymbiont of Villa modesta TaxID=3066293 RepID=UPI00313A92D2